MAVRDRYNQIDIVSRVVLVRDVCVRLRLGIVGGDQPVLPDVADAAPDEGIDAFPKHRGKLD